MLQLWHDSAPGTDKRSIDDLTRFNESIDQSLSKAVASYTKRVDQARDMFLAILSHDLRNPLGAIAMSAHVLPIVSGDKAEIIECGLKIAREIAKSHNGRIDVISTVEEGTSFTVRLPRQTAPRVGQPILDAAHIDKM